MKRNIKQEIYEAASHAKKRNEAAISTLTDAVDLTDYRHLVRESVHGAVWTDALQCALNEHTWIIIPPSEDIYWLDDTIVIPSDRHIEAVGAVIRLVPEYPYIMLRNEHTQDGTHMPIPSWNGDHNISIHGGSWEESRTSRGARRYAKNAVGFCGVQTCMLFNNLTGLTLTDMTFAHTESFSVQVGDLTDGVFENFFFVGCFADGLHVNGNCENLYICNFRGHVGDDLVALNMYDWLGSSINYGPAKNIFCEEIHSAMDSPAKAFRLQPGLFYYDDGSCVDCSLENIYIRHVSGIFEYKLYLQTPPYHLGEIPERSGIGSADHLYFEDIRIDIRGMNPGYAPDGLFGMFMLNSDIGCLSLQDVTYFHDPALREGVYLIVAGPMSWRMGDLEVFDPYAGGTVEVLELENIVVNGERITDADRIVKTIAFDDVNGDGFSSGCGKIQRIVWNESDV